MMTHMAGGALRWEGARVVDRIGRRLAQRLRTVLYLPLEYHPSLSMRIDDRGRIRPRLYTCGDAAMLRRIAGIPGLQPLAALIPGMLELDVRLRVVSPAPHLVFNVPRTAGAAAPAAAVVRERRMPQESLLGVAQGRAHPR